MSDLAQAVARFGASVTGKCSASVVGEAEEQLRSPFEAFLSEASVAIGFKPATIKAIGESSVRSLSVRPDFAVLERDVLVGFVELKAPGKGVEPGKFRDKHDREQWSKLRSLPNLLYSDGSAFALYRNGDLVGSVVSLDGQVDQAGADLKAPQSLQPLLEDFLRWEPTPPRSARELAEVSARLCLFLREEVCEQLQHGCASLESLAADWRALLFPEADDERFADGYAQTVTFGLLAARALDIDIRGSMQEVGRKLTESTTLIGAALRVVTEDVEDNDALRTSFEMLRRVLSVVDWKLITKADEGDEPWLYFYEVFLSIYDNKLRKETGSYYTPPEVVAAMVRLTDELLKSRARFGLAAGFADPKVNVVDPAAGTGTFLLGILRSIAKTVSADEGPGAIAAQIDAAAARLIGFELQLGPFAVAQLRTLAEFQALCGAPPSRSLRLFVTNTLSDPAEDEGTIAGYLRQLAESRRQANRIKREQPITVVIGNPPYKDKAGGKGSWVESGTPHSTPILDRWFPPKGWGVGAHGKHLYNLYVYFWRWAVWKAFEYPPESDEGVVCFITPAGFLAGPGFQKMRADLRAKCSEIWVIECSPEGHRPEVRTRIFEGVQHAVCITIALRCGTVDEKLPAPVHHRRLAPADRIAKFHELGKVAIEDGGWNPCAREWRASFLPTSTGIWGDSVPVLDLFSKSYSGMMPGRIWPIAPDSQTLVRRWTALISAPDGEKERLFRPHLNKGVLGDRHLKKELGDGLPGYPVRGSIAGEPPSSEPELPVLFSYRTLDRQWILPDKRLINRPNPTLWAVRSDSQVYLTLLSRTSPSNGPGATICGLVPDLDHYKGHGGGRAVPLWLDATCSDPNVNPVFLEALESTLGQSVACEDVMAYLASLLTYPEFGERYSEPLRVPGVRVPITADAGLFREAVCLGATSIWLYTFGERFTSDKEGRPRGAPRLPPVLRPYVPVESPIAASPDWMPNEIQYDEDLCQLRFLDAQGRLCGAIANVTPGMWGFRVSTETPLVRQWFSYRKRDRSRPIVGDRRPPSDLNKIQADTWLPEYTTELLNVLNVIGLLLRLGPEQERLLDQIEKGPLLTFEELSSRGVFSASATRAAARQKKSDDGPDLYD
jgi:hypothetical protein